MTNVARPFSPADAKRAFENEVMPAAVINAVNELLTEHYESYSINLLKDDIIDRIIELDPKLDRQIIIDKNYLDFENIFREAGWNVEYNSPDYTESFPQSFTFKQKRS